MTLGIPTVKNIMYNIIPMSITQRNETIREDGRDKEALVVSFTNGAKQQLEELKNHFKASDLLEVVKLGVSFLQRLKEIDDKNKTEGEGNAPK